MIEVEDIRRIQVGIGSWPNGAEEGRNREYTGRLKAVEGSGRYKSQEGKPLRSSISDARLKKLAGCGCATRAERRLMAKELLAHREAAEIEAIEAAGAYPLAKRMERDPLHAEVEAELDRYEGRLKFGWPDLVALAVAGLLLWMALR